MVSGLLFTPCRAVWIHRFLWGAGSPELCSEPCQQFPTCLGCNKGCSWLLCSREWDFIFACCSKETKPKDKQRDYLAKLKMAVCWLWGDTVHSSLGLLKALENLERGKAQQTENIPSNLLSVYRDITPRVIQRLVTTTFAFNAAVGPLLEQNTS